MSTSRDGWPDCPVLHDGGCREWKGRASQTRRMALPFALAGFCSAAGTPARAFNAIPCRRVPNRPRSAWWWRERRLCQIRRIRTQWALHQGPHQGLPDLAPCCAGSFPSSTLIHARPVEDFGFLWLHASMYEHTSGRDSEESGVAANHHLGSSFLILLLLDARREC